MQEKECILLTSHANSVSKQLNLRKLLIKLAELEIDICLTSHISLPQDIVELCSYYIYDAENHLVYDNDYSYWTNVTTQNFSIHYVDSNTVSTHVLAYFKNIFGGINYMGSLGYKKFHYFDYDIIVNNFDEIKENSKLLEDTPIIAYEHKSGGNDMESDTHKITTYIGFNLSYLDLTKINYSPKDILQNYKDYWDKRNLPIIEHLLFDKYLYHPNTLTKPQESIIKSFEINTEFITTPNTSSKFHLHNGDLHFFIKTPNSPHEVEIILNLKDNTKKFIQYQVGIEGKTWGWYNLLEPLENVTYVKLYINNEIIKTIDLTTKEGLDEITKHCNITFV